MNREAGFQHNSPMNRLPSAALLLTSVLINAGCGKSEPPAAATPAKPATAAAPASDVPKIAFEKYTLANGLEVILSQDKRLPMVAVNLWYHVGPANEVCEHLARPRLLQVQRDCVLAA